MTEKTREIKPVSFSMIDRYERELFEYATDSGRGKFGPYVKRLIERDRAGIKAHSIAPDPVIENVHNDAKLREAVGGFL